MKTHYDIMKTFKLELFQYQCELKTHYDIMKTFKLELFQYQCELETVEVS